MTSLTAVASSPVHHEHRMIFGLDLVRALAILVVLIGHMVEHSTLPSWLQHIGRLGGLGVELFFVLSGFLIGGILLRLIEQKKLSSRQDVLQFWKRRWLRTLPLYFLALLAFLRFDYHGGHPLTDHPEYWLFLQNLAWPIPTFFELSWSLSVEEHFYFWFPVLYLLLHVFFSARWAFVLGALSFLVIALSYRASFPLFLDWNDFNFQSRMVVLARVDAIMFGVLMAAIKQYHPAIFMRLASLFPIWAAMVAGVMLWYYIGLPGFMNSYALQVWGMTFQAMLLALLLPWFSHWIHVPRNGMGSLVVMTSRLSYSLYLGHVLVIVFVNALLSRLGLFEQVYSQVWMLYPIYFGGFCAGLVYLPMELPFLSLRDASIQPVDALRLIAPYLILCSILVLWTKP